MPETHNYQILREHHRTDGSFKSIESLEMEYINLTDRLIHKMTHGEQVTVNGETKNVIPTKVVFLDKSARPLAWLTRDLWDDLAPEPGEDIPKKPDFKFLNIDRNQWLDIVDPNENGSVDISKISEDQIIGLRSIFGKSHEGGFETENDLDDEIIMVVDEVKSSGKTLKIAEGILRRAFPSSVVFGAHWMSKMYEADGVEANADLPVWYKDDREGPKYEVGRGVGNRKIVDGGPDSQYFLSTRFARPDQRALRLREDFKRLAESLGDRVPYIPDMQRDDDNDTLEKRSQAINKRSYRQVMLARGAILASDKER